MARKTIRRLLEKSFGSEWDQLIRKVRRRRATRFLIFWNRGLGDIALGLQRIVHEIRVLVPEAHITILTRDDIADAFGLLAVDRVLIDPLLRRQARVDAGEILRRLGVHPDAFDVILDRPDPTHWFRGMPPFQPRLQWSAAHDASTTRFDECWPARSAPTIDVAVHVSSETASFYRYEKDWPPDAWRTLFERVQAVRPVRFILFGHRSDEAFGASNCIDLRGKTSVLEMMALIRQRCQVLIAPDSGVLTMTYYLDVNTPLDVISLWADPRQGVIKQGVSSPNPRLRHRIILAPDERIGNISVDSVISALDALLDDRVDASGRDATSATSAPAYA